MLILIATSIFCVFTFVAIRYNEKNWADADASIRCKRATVVGDSLNLVIWVGMLMIFMLVEVVEDGTKGLLENGMFQRLSAVLLTIAVYDLLLLLFHKRIRRHFSANLLPALWLAPNVLYMYLLLSVGLPTPRLMIPVNARLALILFWIWFVGFAACLSKSVISHLSFRSHVMKGAVEVTDEEILSVYEAELARYGETKLPKTKLMIAKDLQTPLTIGMDKNCLLLPDRPYTAQELSWIFRHELVHIYNHDCQCKFFIAFCRSVFWFLPGSRLLCERVSEDLELSCDQMVVQEEPASDRKAYARLILRSTGETRGFTSCLSAGGHAMQYRLGRIMKEEKSFGFKEGLVLCLTTVLLVLACGQLQLTTRYGNVADLELLSQNSRLQTVGAEDEFFSEGVYDSYEAVYSHDAEAFISAMQQLKAYQITNQDESLFVKEYLALFEDGDDLVRFVFSDHHLTVYNTVADETEYYYLPDDGWKELF